MILFILAPWGAKWGQINQSVTNTQDQPATAAASFAPVSDTRESWRRWGLKWGSNGGNRGDGGYGCYWRSCLHHVMCKREGWGECSGVCMKERERESWEG